MSLAIQYGGGAAEFSLYRVVDMTENREFTLAGKFADCPVSLENLDTEGSTWLRFLRRRERQSGVVFKTLFFRTKRTFRRPRREKGAETALGIGNSVPGRSRVGIKGSGPERGSLLQRHRRLP